MESTGVYNNGEVEPFFNVVIHRYSETRSWGQQLTRFIELWNSLGEA
jgi:hypothetical protein